MSKKRSLWGLSALLLFGVFAACLMLVLLTGAGSYQRLTQRDQLAYDRRTCVQYIAAKVRQSDRVGAVAVEPFGDAVALTLSEDIEGQEYVTRIYAYDGYLMELFSARDVMLEPEAGAQIMPVKELSVQLDDGRVLLTCVDQAGVETELTLSLRCGKAGMA